MSVDALDSFITNSVTLLEANPSETVLSVTYNPKAKSGKVAFKTHNSKLSTRFKFTTSRSKDVSRLLSALGPRGVSINNGKIEKKRTGKKVQAVGGMSTLLANVDVPEALEEPIQQAKPSKPASGKKKKNKKR
ncbi:SRP9-21 domain-containing protein [Lachancea thermotolerans]|uniref:KLTH0D04972p n=1 Tax=Lachancea thermotolerans (strain ATCC 56472 / CBS 6340 / NRRL Y-8284) TaxID=559295 RepID=C5DGF8_LACTC|nr:KLTH0D04972p [Lachancea thermotolerans CBS 6340]CAR22500.1 KLTH0D04972p [Lachancea thermotolerans CBS 6340]